MGFLDKLLGNTSESKLKKMRPVVDKINKLEDTYASMSDEELRRQTSLFKERLAKGETLDQLLPEAFAVVREAAKRTVDMRPYDVQLLGGMVLHQGRIAEMKTGEGKTLVATLPAYLNALEGKGVYIVTVNDYLARRDAQWMGKIHRFLGLSVGCIVHDLSAQQRREAYACDITYGTNNEFGFDYLRDNMVVYKESMVQRELHYAIVDEVDSILIDEARTPLIISGQGEESSEMYREADRFVRRLTRGEDMKDVSKSDQLMGIEQVESGDYMCDIRRRTVQLTAQGIAKAEAWFKVESLADAENTELNHYIKQALRAHALFTKDKDYVVQNGQVLIVDEFTGRLMIGRRYSEGLHQALEAKEGVKVEKENKTLATITFQNYFRMFHKLAGMTGTAKTEEDEFTAIYGLDVVEIPTNRPCVRQDMPDMVYTTELGKFRAVVNEIQEKHKTGQPLLVGTISVEKSEYLSAMLQRAGIPHQVLNAKYHAKEAQIVAQAGKLGAVTIATNMAGRGTDIKLSPEVKAAGGLAIIGTERHESRRVDRQLRGRAGRQGDPGSSVFYVSLEDKLMRLFASERIAKVMDKLGFKEGDMIDSPMISRSIERAQKKVEENNFGIRKRLLEYDDVMNKQRTVVYEKRRHALMGERIGMDISNIIWDRVVNIIEQNDYEGCKEEFLKILAMEVPFTDEQLANEKREDLAENAFQVAMADFKRKTERIQAVAWPIIKQVYETQGSLYERIMVPITDGRRMYNIPCDLKEAYDTECKSVVKQFEKVILLHIIDDCWKENLRELDELKHSVQNASYEQKDPLLIFKLESVKLFDSMVNTMNNRITSILMRSAIPEMQQSVKEAEPDEKPQQPRYTETKRNLDEEQLTDPNQAAAAAQDTRAQQQREPIVKDKLPGRNDPCPCGSGKKFKNCHGRGLV